MFSKILIAYDGSDHSKRAAKIAGEFARDQQAEEICVITVLEPIPSELGSPYVDEIISKRTIRGDELINQAKEIINGTEPLKIEAELLFGNPASSIMEVARTRKSDLIIMGTRGLGGLRGLLLGSQIQKVIGLAECPVMAIK